LETAGAVDNGQEVGGWRKRVINVKAWKLNKCSGL
jgi:hypothetical protein